MLNTILYHNISPVLLQKLKNVNTSKKIISMIDDSLGCGEIDLKYVNMFINDLISTQTKFFEVMVPYNSRKSNGGIW